MTRIAASTPPRIGSAESRAADLACAIGCGLAAVVLFAPYVLGAAPAALFFDDFYYYVVVADAVLERGHFEFFPGVATNGFHPLWMLFLLAIRAAAGSDTVFLMLVSASLWLASISILYGLRQLLYRMTGDSLATAAGICVALPGVLGMVPSGLEVGLTLALLGGLWIDLYDRPLAERDLAGALRMGILAAAVVLSRLDAVLVVAPVLTTSIWKRGDTLGDVSRRGFGFAIGLLPLWLYLVANQLAFGSWLPLSGMAKQLAPGFLPHLSALSGVWRSAETLRTFSALAAAAWLAGSVCSAMRSDRGANRNRFERGLLAMPILFFGVQASTTDWPLGFWYLYPLVWASACGGALGFARAAAVLRGRVALRAGVVLLALVSLDFPLRALLRPGQNWIYELDRRLAARIEAQPGRYAMGDCAGTLAFLSPHPVLQAEGLVMDRRYLERIRAEDDLVGVLRDYDIDVYITLRARRKDGCFQVEEPAVAGPRSPRLRGHFCGEPLFEVQVAGATARAFAVPGAGEARAGEDRSAAARAAARGDAADEGADREAENLGPGASVRGKTPARGRHGG